MSFKLQDLSEFQLQVNGQDMQIGVDNLKEVSLIENIREGMPNIAVTFLDAKQAGKGFSPYQDGVPITVTVGDGTKQATQYKFRQWSIQDGSTGSAGETITLHGMADVVPWFTQAMQKNVKGHTHELVSQLAKMGGVPVSIIEAQTQDLMNHLPDGRTLMQFARRAVDHAWIGSGSSPHLGLTSVGGQWAVRLSDIMKPAANGSSVRLVSAGLAKPGDSVVWDFKVHSTSGAANKFANYGHKSIQEDTSGVADVFNLMQMAMQGGALGINSAMQGAVGLVRTKFFHPSVGNTHNNYVQAFQNNRKSRATFTSVVHVMLDKWSGLKLMDDVYAALANSGGQADPSLTGTYKVTALTRYVSGGSYREKLEISSQGSNQSGGSGVQ